MTNLEIKVYLCVLNADMQKKKKVNSKKKKKDKIGGSLGREKGVP